VSLAWEEIAEFVRAKEPAFGAEFAVFYDECRRFNRIREPEAASGPAQGGQ